MNLTTVQIRQTEEILQTRSFRRGLGKRHLDRDGHAFHNRFMPHQCIGLPILVILLLP